MTLILSCLTPDHAIQVSDRRLTFPDGTVADDQRNKGTLFERTYAVGYTGLANLGGMPTDVWTTMVLGNADPTDPFMSLAAAAKGALDKVSAPQARKRMAFCAIGWVREPQREGFTPTVTIVSNFLSEEMMWLPEAKSDFFVKDLWLDVDDAILLAPPIGAVVPLPTFQVLFRKIRIARSRKVSPIAIARLMADAIRMMAQRTTTVGEDLLVMIVPKPVGTPSDNLISGPPGTAAMSSCPTCYIMPKDKTILEWVMPNTVRDGWVVTDHQLKWTAPDQQSLSCCIRRRGMGRTTLFLGDQAGNIMMLEMLEDSSKWIRKMQPGFPDEVSELREPQ